MGYGRERGGPKPTPTTAPSSQRGSRFLLISALTNRAPVSTPEPAPRQIITMRFWLLGGSWRGRTSLGFSLSMGIFRPTHSCLIWRRKKKCVNGPFLRLRRTGYREVRNLSLMRSNFPLILNYSPHPVDLGQRKWRPSYETVGMGRGLEGLSSYLSPGLQPTGPSVSIQRYSAQD